MDLSILTDQEGFRTSEIEALARQPVDFLEEAAFIKGKKGSPTPWEGAGILLPLYLQPAGEGKDSGEYVFLLNKRARNLPQGGDLCAPGGGMHPGMDGLLRMVLSLGILPWARGPGMRGVRQREKKSYQAVLLFLSNALRESWEEIRLSPANVEFLGALPCYRLQSRRWIIFPIVGRVKHPWSAKLSPEVEKIVPIPISGFFNPGNYATFAP
jgi:8-oxo-dGTP pyrophosphatase MutT (NUDIX family)